jgi:hypothetical protein
METVEEIVEIKKIIWLNGPNPIVLFFEIAIVGRQAVKKGDGGVAHR